MYRIFTAALLLTSFTFMFAQAPQATEQLTIEKIFAEGGVTGRAPESVQWSPDGNKVSFVQRDDSGDRGALWYVDPATGQKAVLVAEQKLAALKPLTQATQEEKERQERYSVGGYFWSPDSKRSALLSHQLQCNPRIAHRDRFTPL